MEKHEIKSDQRFSFNSHVSHVNLNFSYYLSLHFRGETRCRLDDIISFVLYLICLLHNNFGARQAIARLWLLRRRLQTLILINGINFLCILIITFWIIIVVFYRILDVKQFLITQSLAKMNDNFHDTRYYLYLSLFNPIFEQKSL